jgi:CheY-like chemotaxis protein
MKDRIFLIHWKTTETQGYAEQLRLTGWRVESESEDGARACQRIKESLPDIIVIFLSRLPSHGRETAHALRSMRSTRAVPIVFVDGKEDAIEKTRQKVPDAIYTPLENLHSLLLGLSRQNESEVG